MQTRRQAIATSAAVAAALFAAGVFPARAQAGWNKAAFDAKAIDDVLKAMGAGKPVSTPAGSSARRGGCRNTSRPRSPATKATERRVRRPRRMPNGLVPIPGA